MTVPVYASPIQVCQVVQASLPLTELCWMAPGAPKGLRRQAPTASCLTTVPS